ncbi:tRNA (adenine(22)-N(1))-methyltransferase [Fonticella tunisiensis]|uniref:tRNA (Adenine22-N1)-methyltransferase n=1 Tax=Fonticella tunisiensis TaxID=1096341 RepID=A0A4R7KBL2_9CLOT|nr:class I SAM-dependent methyltransferase [Fonticella tunisiensis]TDT51083.1 tRNA (adenine22-N1)-methyltransferase [Fonticella tunisiensis]
MNLSKRLKHIVKMIPSCRCLADIGTDHGYIPIYTVMNNISKYAIASDINQGPINAAIQNIKKFNLNDKIQTRVGSGLSTITEGEADVIVIAGMGGTLITEILAEGSPVARQAEYLILQPVQYPEVLRKYLVNNGYIIIDEDIVKEDNKYYQVIKAANGISKPYDKEVYYYIGKILIDKGNPLLKEYIEYKMDILKNILEQLSEKQQVEKYRELSQLINEFKDVILCL